MSRRAIARRAPMSLRYVGLSALLQATTILTFVYDAGLPGVLPPTPYDNDAWEDGCATSQRPTWHT